MFLYLAADNKCIAACHSDVYDIFNQEVPLHPTCTYISCVCVLVCLNDRVLLRINVLRIVSPLLRFSNSLYQFALA